MPAPTSSRSADTKPLPLSDTLQDLAVLRASGIEFSAFLPSSSTHDQDMKTKAVASSTILESSSDHLDEQDSDRLVTRSFDYVREARAAIRLLHHGHVDSQGARIDSVRSGLEDILRGLDQGADQYRRGYGVEEKCVPVNCTGCRKIEHVLISDYAQDVNSENFNVAASEQKR
ncbi:hypothetical protein DFH11DRAFT_1540028 [Phellopilus nigrolimitatus]|nr:hypothetical protein DFH11DRAFT_1540028 [Phellopilus nigrolimitatus]